MGRKSTEADRAYMRAYYQRNRAKIVAKSRAWRAANKDAHDEASLKRTHGIDRAEYDAMFAAQNGVCAICKKPETRRNKNRVYRLHVDHDHETGKIRALLCHHCNAGIGHFFDRPELLREAADYLTRHGGD